MARLPKAENAIIAEHEAGRHDVYNGGYPTKGPMPETCRECAKIAKAEAGDGGAKAILPRKAKPPIPKTSPVEPGPKVLSDLLVISPPEPRKAKAARTRLAKARLAAATDAAGPDVLAALGLPGVVVDTNTVPVFAKPLADPIVKPLPKPRVVRTPVETPRESVTSVPLIPIDVHVGKYADPVVIGKPAPVTILGAIAVPEGGYGTREAWMLAAVEAFRPWFIEEGEVLPPVRISMGWPGGRGNKQNVLGQCWAASAVDDGVPALFVTPSQRDAVEVLETILHESIHAAGHMHHRSPFQKVARKFGFVNGGKAKTSREQSPDLYATLDEMAAALGPFPHAAVTSAGGLGGLDPKGPPVQSTRMLKVWCENDGYTLRATKKWLQVAIPACPVCETEMQVEWT